MVRNALHRMLRSPWLIWGLGATFFLAEYFARVSPSVMTNELMQAFSVNAAVLGTISFCFYIAYISMQLPVGMLVDRYGPHRLLTCMAVLCGIGSIMFASAHTEYEASIGRLLMGFSAAFAFVGSLKLASVWFPPRRFGLLAGLTQGLGMIGASIGEAPTALLLGVIGWRNTVYVFAMVFFVLGILIWFLVRDYPTDYPQTKIRQNKESHILASLFIVLKNPQTWVNALFVGLIYAPSASFGELWGVSFLSRVYEVDKAYAATAIGLIFIGFAAGAPLVGYISDKIQRRKPMMYVSSILSLIFLTLVLYVTHIPFSMVYVLLFCYGMVNAGLILGYAMASEINPHRIAGTSMAFSNMASVIFGAALQPIMGKILVLRWAGVYENGVPFYSAHDYQLAVIILPISLALAFVAVMFLKETYCRPLDYAPRKGMSARHEEEVGEYKKTN